MKALICNEFGSTKNLILEEVKSPEPGAGQVLIDVHAAGINFPDVLTVQGNINSNQVFHLHLVSKCQVLSKKLVRM